MMKDRVLIPLLVASVEICWSLPVEVLEGPGGEAPLMRSDLLLPEELPMEHRGDVLVLPTVFSIPRQVTSKLGVDLFFSLFFVFLDDIYQITGQTVGLSW